MEKNAKNAAFFYKEQKRTQVRCVLLKRTDAQPWVPCAATTVVATGVVDIVGQKYPINSAMLNSKSSPLPNHLGCQIIFDGKSFPLPNTKSSPLQNHLWCQIIPNAKSSPLPNAKSFPMPSHLCCQKPNHLLCQMPNHLQWQNNSDAK